METATINRAEILQEIRQHELRIAELRAMLPSAIKRFYRFRCRPESHVWTYADSREQAESRLRERMNNSYGSGGWSIAVNVVDVFDDPQFVAANSPGNLFRSLSEAEALEFLTDLRENTKGRADKPKLKDLGKNQLEQDADDYERYLRQRDKK